MNSRLSYCRWQIGHSAVFIFSVKNSKAEEAFSWKTERMEKCSTASLNKLLFHSSYHRTEKHHFMQQDQDEGVFLPLVIIIHAVKDLLPASLTIDLLLLKDPLQQVGRKKT